MLVSVVLGISSVTNIVFGLQDITIGNRITLLCISLKMVNMIIDDERTTIQPALQKLLRCILWKALHEFDRLSILFRELSDPLPLAEKEAVHNIVRQDLKKEKFEEIPSSVSAKMQHKKPIPSADSINDFVTTKKTCSFVNKYYKNKTQIRGY